MTLIRPLRNTVPAFTTLYTSFPYLQDEKQTPSKLGLLPLPPAFTEEHKSASGWPVGADFVAAFLDGVIVIWGGMQKQCDGSYSDLPTDVVYRLEIQRGKSSTINVEWRVIPATGAIHPGNSGAATVTMEGLSFILGGFEGSLKLSNAFSTLSSTGEFKRLRPIGDIPSPRSAHRGWAFEGKIYFFGGLVEEEWSYPRADCTPVGLDLSCTNSLHRYDPRTNAFKLVEASGVPPSPRSSFAVAQLEHQVFIHGGQDDTQLADLRVLNLHTVQWTLLQRGSMSFSHHALFPARRDKIMLVGGRTENTLSKAIFVFDVEQGEWAEESALPPEFGQGLTNFCAVQVQLGNSPMVVCIGGFTDFASAKHPNFMVILQ